MEQQLIDAVEQQDFNLVKFIVEQDSNLCFIVEILRKALKLQNIDVADYLVKKVDMKRALLHAIDEGDLNLVKYFVEKGADIVRNHTPLFQAVQNNQLKIIVYLIEHGAEKIEAFVNAAMFGHFDIVKYCLDSGVDIHWRDDLALILVVENKNMKLVKYLVEQGANIRVKNDEALKTAIEVCHVELIEYLVSKGADIHAQLRLLLQTSIEYQNMDLFKYYVKIFGNVPQITIKNMTNVSFAVYLSQVFNANVHCHDETWTILMTFFDKPQQNPITHDSHFDVNLGFLVSSFV